MKDSSRVKDLCLEVTQKCLLRCKHCSSESGPSKDTALPMKTVTRTINEAEQLGLETISISGGEPLTYPYLDLVLEECERNGLKTRLYTSGNTENNGVSPVTEERIKQLSGLGVDKLIFSVLGGTPETHDELTQTPGSFKNTVESIRNTVDADIETEIHSVVMKPNYDELEQVINLGRDLEVNNISILRFVPQGRGESNKGELSLSEEQRNNLSDKLVEASENIGIRIGAPFNALNIANTDACNIGMGKVCIEPTGATHPCEAMKQIHDGENIYRNPLPKIMKGLDKNKFLNNLNTEQTSFKRGNGCIAQSLLHEGTVNTELDPFKQSR